MVYTLDCTLRDGGHPKDKNGIKWNFPDFFAVSYLNTIRKSGIDIAELGYRTTPNTMENVGNLRYSTEEYLRKIIKWATGSEKLEGIKTAIMADMGKIEERDFNPKSESSIDLVRIATYRQGIEKGIQLVNHLHELGYETSLNLMASIVYPKEELENHLKKIKDSKADLVSVVDSFGSYTPEKVGEHVELFRQITGKPTGYHGHNNLELAIENAKTAIEAGALFIDSTIGEIGRGRGNLGTEDLDQINGLGEGLNLEEVLRFKNTNLESFRIQSGVKWGANLLNRKTGEKSIHPGYAILLEEMGYLEDIEKAYKIIDGAIQLGAGDKQEFDEKIIHEAIKTYQEETIS